jgi:cytolysin-activating lysine-acyltransferase
VADLPPSIAEGVRLPDSAPHTVSHMFGEIVWLMSQSAAHKHFAIADLEWMVMPALLLTQYRLFHKEGRPIGAALWAFLSEEAEAKLSVTPLRLRPDEWKSGDRCWLLDLIAPGATPANKLAAVILDDLGRTALSGRSFSFHKVNLATGKREILKVGMVS